MLVQPTEDEGEGSERPSEPQLTPSPPHPGEVQVEPQSNPSPRPSSTTHIPDSIPESFCRNHVGQVTDQAKEIKHLKAQIKKLKKKAKPVITHHKAWVKSVFLKAKLAEKEKPAFNELDDDEINYMETKDVQDVGKTNIKKVSTDKEKDSTDKVKDSTDRPNEGTVDQTEGRSATLTTPTPTPTIFGDDETIAQVLLNTSQAKAVLREKEKGVELMDVENIERPRPTRSLLTLNPLPKIDPKDKGKKKIKEEESDTESEDINESEKKFKMLAHDEEIARKVQEDWEAEEEVKKLAEEEATNAALIQDFDDIKARIEADRLLALRLQDKEREREQFTVEERAKFLHDTIAAQRRFLAEQRAIAIRNRPPTRTQLRSQMMTYLKHVGNKKHSDLKNKTFEEIQALYEKVKRFDESFTVVSSTEDERKIKEMNEGAKDLEHKRPKEEDTAKVPAKVEVTEYQDSEIMERKTSLLVEQGISHQMELSCYLQRPIGKFQAFNISWSTSYLDSKIFHEYDQLGNEIMMETHTEENDQVILSGSTRLRLLLGRLYPHSKELLQRMLDLDWRLNRESTDA
ncbi:hypothetical protein Tco_0771249 [Tanacetum coccineum]|uniref:Uncharacterized protein n=1 Tax=Tanacetum coccineum TaxID=301880 RepID=A0ABQ4ZIL7_9ASTR